MKNKKGFLLGEYTLKVIIAIMSLSLLVYLLFSFYSGFQKDKKISQAKASLDKITEKMVLAKEKGKPQEVTLLNPKKGYLGYWKKGEERPEECSDYCLCICMGFGYYKEILNSNKVSKCGKPRVCKNFKEDVINTGKIEFPTDLKISYNGGKYEIKSIEIK